MLKSVHCIKRAGALPLSLPQSLTHSLTHSHTLSPTRRYASTLTPTFTHGYQTLRMSSTSSSTDESRQGMAELRNTRLGKIHDMTSQGVIPYAYKYTVTHSATQLQEMYQSLENGSEDTSQTVCSVAGRIMMRRFFGKLAFFQLQDQSGSIQLYIDKKIMGTEFRNLKDWTDSGDIIGVSGTLKRTDKGELSIIVTDWNMLTKSLHPLPDKFHGLTDIKKRYANRSADMIVNPEVRQTLYMRSLIIKSIRSLLDEMQYIEAETPVLHNQPGGAEAKPFRTYHNSLDMDLTLRIATELHLKRLIVGGFDRVYEIGRIFRNEGLSSRHNPEFTSVELYQAYADYDDMMNLTERLISNAVQATASARCADSCHPMVLTYQDTSIDFSKPYRRVAMHDIVREVSGIVFDDFANYPDGLEQAKAAAITAGVPNTKEFQNTQSILEIMNITFEELCEKTLIQPTFVIDHPVETSPLAKPHRTKPGYVERFELYIYGREIANAFSELTDPIDQRERFEKQIKDVNNESEIVKVDEEFLQALELGMPPTGGLGVGIDRLVMLLTDSASIRDVLAFPLQKQQP